MVSVEGMIVVVVAEVEQVVVGVIVKVSVEVVVIQIMLLRWRWLRGPNFWRSHLPNPTFNYVNFKYAFSPTADFTIYAITLTKAPPT